MKSDLLSAVSFHGGGDELANEICNIIDLHVPPIDCCDKDKVSVLRAASKMLKTMPFYNAKCVLDNLDKLADSLEKKDG